MALTREDSHQDLVSILVVNEASNTLSIIDAANCHLLATIPVGKHPHEVAVSPSGQYALVSNFRSLFHPWEWGQNKGNSLTYIDVVNRKKLYDIPLSEDKRAVPHGVIFLSEDEALATAEGEDALYRVNVKTQAVNDVIKLHLPEKGIHGKGAHTLVVDDKRQFAYVCCAKSGTVCRVALQDDNSVAAVFVSEGCEGIAISADNKHLYVASRGNNKLYQLKTDDFFTATRELATCQGGPVRVAEFDHGRAVAVTNCTAGTIETFDVTTGKQLGYCKPFQQVSRTNGRFFGGLLPVPICIEVTPDQATAYVTNLYAGKVGLVNLKECKVIHDFEAGKGVDGLAISRRRS